MWWLVCAAQRPVCPRSVARAHTEPLAGMCGECRGSGRQETGAITNLMSYWILGIPLAAYLAFK